MSDIADATGMAADIRRGRLSPRESVADAISMFEKYDTALNTLVAERFDAALVEANAGPAMGPLTGVPTIVKNLRMQVEGLPTTHGSRLWAASKVATQDSELVARLRRAGMIVLGMSNSPELGKNASTEPVLHGPTRNPWSTEFSPGGSSGGSAAAVAAGLVPAAHASDGGGSIRIPSAMCGLFGLKPTRGRVTSAPNPGPLASPMSVDHVVARTVRDSALLLDIVGVRTPGSAVDATPSGGSFVEEMRSDPGRLRVGLLGDRPDGGDVSRETLGASEAAALLCEELGHHVVEIEWRHDQTGMMRAAAVLGGVNLVHHVDERLIELDRPLRENDLEPFTGEMYERYKSTLSAADVYQALCTIEQIGWEVGQLFREVDILVSPTLPSPVPELGYLDTTNLKTIGARSGDYSAMTSVFNVTGQPAMSIPFGLDSSGLPIGVQFAADTGQEGLLLSLATRLEEANPWPLVAPGYLL